MSKSGSVSRGFLFMPKTDKDRHPFAWLYYCDLNELQNNRKTP